MSRLRHVALVVLLLLAGQMAGAAMATAACCCPAMAGTEGSAPCASLSAVGCCEAQAKAATPDPIVPPTEALPACAADLSTPAASPRRPTPPPLPLAAERALRHTILRL